MKHLRKCTALLLAVLMVLALAACGQKDDTAAVDKDLTVNVVSLNGTTGFGMAKLMADSKAGNAALNYSFTVETDPSNATGLSESKPTSDDGLFTIEIVSCLGACGLSPVVMVNDTVHPAMTPDKAVDLIEELRAKEGA